MSVCATIAATVYNTYQINKKQERTPLLPKVSKQETTTAQSRIVVTVSSKQLFCYNMIARLVEGNDGIVYLGNRGAKNLKIAGSVFPG